MASDTDRLIRTVQELLDGDGTRPKPGAAFLRAIADYAEASRRLAAAQRALLAQVERFEAAVRMANGEADDAPGDVPGDVTAEVTRDAVPSSTGRTPRRVSRGMPAGCAAQPGHRTARRAGGLDRRG